MPQEEKQSPEWQSIANRILPAVSPKAALGVEIIKAMMSLNTDSSVGIGFCLFDTLPPVTQLKIRSFFDLPESCHILYAVGDSVEGEQWLLIFEEGVGIRDTQGVSNFVSWNQIERVENFEEMLGLCVYTHNQKDLCVLCLNMAEEDIRFMVNILNEILKLCKEEKI